MRWRLFTGNISVEHKTSGFDEKWLKEISAKPLKVRITEEELIS